MQEVNHITPPQLPQTHCTDWFLFFRVPVSHKNGVISEFLVSYHLKFLPSGLACFRLESLLESLGMAQQYTSLALQLTGCLWGPPGQSGKELGRSDFPGADSPSGTSKDSCSGDDHTSSDLKYLTSYVAPGPLKLTTSNQKYFWLLHKKKLLCSSCPCLGSHGLPQVVPLGLVPYQRIFTAGSHVIHRK
jgi:hypothetical protein